jgi:hypothetical protein
VAPVTHTIVCAECGDESEGKARGWRAYLFHQQSTASELVEEVAIYCPACAAREFDDDAA